MFQQLIFQIYLVVQRETHYYFDKGRKINKQKKNEDYPPENNQIKKKKSAFKTRALSPSESRKRKEKKPV